MDIKSKIYELTQLKADIESVFGNPAGERVLLYLMKEAGIPKKQGMSDPNSLLIQEGKQLLVYSILRLKNTDPTEILNKIQEQYNDN